MSTQDLELAVFGGGCFWCTEAVFKMLKGVVSISPGYTGGNIKNPTYEQVCGGNTGHAESIKIEFDPTIISFHDLLTVFFGSHDSTTRNRQGNDIGTQYRSVVFYSTPEQQKIALDYIAELNASNKNGDPVLTEVVQLGEFYTAESYHSDYYARNSDESYCQIIISPKLEKVQQKYAELLADPTLHKAK